MNFLTINQQKLKVFSYCILCISLIIISYACSDAIYSSSETEDTGSIAFSVEWIGPPTIKGNSISAITRALDCNAAGVATVEGKIYDQNNTYLAGGGPWNCEAHAGMIENVPEGSNRKAEILGKNPSGDIIYQGETTGIEVIADQTTDAGEITVSLAIPTNVSANAGDGEITLSWDSVASAISYNIYWDAITGVSIDTGNIISGITTTSYTHSGLINGDPNYYVITALFYGGESGESLEVSATPTSPIYVPTDQSTIQDAIDAASDGDMIIVSDGIYKGTGNKNLDFKGKKIILQSESVQPKNCKIDCEGDGRAFYFHSGETSQSVISGFTIMNGFSENGGGIYCNNVSSPKIINCIINYNTANDEGGGIYCGDGSSPTIINCVIYANNANYTGGGIQCDWNTYPTIINCTIAHNDNFGIYCNDSSPTITNCIFYGNYIKEEWSDLYPDMMKYPGIVVNTMASGVQYPNVTYSALNDTYIGEGNIVISEFPFVFLYDYHLNSNSNAIDTGTSQEAPDTDIEGILRPQGNGYDMGAYEYH